MSLAVSLHGEVLEVPLVQIGALDPSSAPVPGVLSDKTSPFSPKPSPICIHPQTELREAFVHGGPQAAEGVLLSLAVLSEAPVPRAALRET